MTNVPAGAPPDGDSGFLSRWSRRKAQVRQGAVLAEPVEPAPPPMPAVPVGAPTGPPARPVLLPLPPGVPAAAAEPAPAALAPCPSPPPPTLADVAALTRDSDYARFVAPGVDVGIKNAALKKLFTDPHFNIMDRLDTYIDDYSLPDPLPAGMLRQMVQSHALGLFDEVPEQAAGLDAPDPPDAPNPPGTAPSPAAAAQPAPAIDCASEPIPEPIQATDEDPDLRLQPHPAAGPNGPGQGLVPDPGRER